MDKSTSTIKPLNKKAPIFPFLESNMLYKYRDFSNPFHKKSLEGEVYFASIKEFNDPFDGRFPFEITQKIHKNMKFNESIESLCKRIIRNDFLPSYLNSLPKMIDFIYESIENDLLIHCLSENKDNILMWSHYANNHKGFVIGYDKEKFCEKLEAGFQNVKYTEQMDETLLNNMPAYEFPFYKHLPWHYEKEVRFIFENNNQISKPRKKRVENCIKEVILGVKMSEIDKKLIIEYCKKHLANVAVLQARLNKIKVNLEFDRIN